MKTLLTMELELLQHKHGIHSCSAYILLQSDRKQLPIELLWICRINKGIIQSETDLDCTRCPVFDSDCIVGHGNTFATKPLK